LIDAGVLNEIGVIVGAQHLLTSPEELVLYGYDATPAVDVVRPDAVVHAGSAEEIAEIVRLANRTPFYVIPRGAGTGLTGGARPIRGGVVISTQRMNRILRIDADNLQAVVQPGVVTDQLDKQARAQGLFYAPDPQSMATCSIGGNLAENAGGPHAVKYGVTRQSVLALQAVLPEGQLVRLGARTLKSVAGYDLLSLLLGSEGTLGVITEATLRLLPLPEARRTLLASFAEVEEAAAAVGATFRAGVLPAAIEFMDGNAIRCVEDYEGSSLTGLVREAGAVLIIELDGGAGDVERTGAIVERVMREGKAKGVKLAKTEEEAEGLWSARRAVGPALAKIAPLKVNEDIVVPLSGLPRAVAGIHSIGAEQDIKCAIFGHAGDGNLHVNFLADPQNSDEVRRVERAVDEMFALVISLGGSITGEHGVGTTKQKYLSLELSEESMDAMRAIKAALDPRGIMNPAKIFPERAEDGA